MRSSPGATPAPGITTCTADSPQRPLSTTARFFLYYQGAEEYSEQHGTVTFRTIGLATSTDGITFTKHPRNPIISWHPNNGHEEGAVSAGASLDESGNVVLVYGANTRVNDWMVNADGRVAASADGYTFSDSGVLLDHRESSLWGGGHEVFPVISFQARGNTYVYYIPNGTAQRGRLGVAWGAPGRLRSSAVSTNGKHVDAWGMGGHARIGEDIYALFLNDVRKVRLEVRTVHLDRPESVSAPIRTYAFADFGQGTVYLDRDAGRWYLFHRTRNGTAYRVRVAPVVEVLR